MSKCLVPENYTMLYMVAIIQTHSIYVHNHYTLDHLWFILIQDDNLVLHSDKIINDYVFTICL